MFFGTEILEFSIGMKHVPWGKSIEGRFHSWAEKLSSKASALWKLLSFKKGNWRYPLSLSFFVVVLYCSALVIWSKGSQDSKATFHIFWWSLESGQQKMAILFCHFRGKKHPPLQRLKLHFSRSSWALEARFSVAQNAPLRALMFLAKSF